MALIIDTLDNTFIETLPGESEEAWRGAVEEVLTNVFDPPKVNWWHPFTVGPVVEWSGRRFRSFQCIAGSVAGWLFLAAMRGNLARGLMVLGRRHTDDRLQAEFWCQGQKTVVDGEEIASQLPRPDTN